MNKDNDKNSSTLIIIRGLPGSGKSTIANELVENDLARPIVLLDPDKIDFDSETYNIFAKNLINDGVDPKLFPYRFLRNKAHETIGEGGTVVWTQAFTNQDMLDRTIKNLSSYASDKFQNLKVLVVDVEIDQKTARERINKRVELGQNEVSDENFKRFVNDFKLFNNYDYDSIIIDGNTDVNNSVEAILNKLRTF